MSKELQFIEESKCIQFFKRKSGELEVVISDADDEESIGIWITRQQKQELREWLNEPTGESEVKSE